MTFGQEVAHWPIQRTRQPDHFPCSGNEREGSLNLPDCLRWTASNQRAGLLNRHVEDALGRGMSQVNHFFNIFRIHAPQSSALSHKEKQLASSENQPRPIIACCNELLARAQNPGVSLFLRWF